MRITNDTKNKKNVGADASVRPTSKARQNSGITLIALIITIIVMLILVVVTITIAINGGLFEKAGEAVGDMQNAIDSEQQLANGMLNIGGIWYDSIDDYLAGKGRNDVYAILYDDGTFAFNSTGKKIEGKTVVFKSENIGITTFNTAEEVPWSSYVSDIKTVVIEDLIKPYSTSRWFYGCSNLTEIQNIENLNTCFVTTMYCMFYGCSGLTSLDVSSFDTSNVTTMAGMFGSGANATMELTEIKGLDKFDTSKVTDMYAMFKKCTKLTSLDLSSFDTSNVTTMQSMFNGCSSLTSLDVSNFDTSNVTTMAYMFNSCSSLTNL
ncbi:MAG: BspA family leucine-rich repeat surface protein, partial [Clostridia bacterium]